MNTMGRLIFKLFLAFFGLLLMLGMLLQPVFTGVSQAQQLWVAR